MRARENEGSSNGRANSSRRRAGETNEPLVRSRFQARRSLALVPLGSASPAPFPSLAISGALLATPLQRISQPGFVPQVFVSDSSAFDGSRGETGDNMLLGEQVEKNGRSRC
jgi:hypothetical protein